MLTNTVCARAANPVAGVPLRLRGADRHQSPGAGVENHPDGTAQLAFLLDRAWRETGRDHPESHRHLPLTRHRCLHLPGRCAATREHPSRERRDRSHTACVGDHVLPRSHEIRYRARRSITAWFGRLPGVLGKHPAAQLGK